MFESKVGFQFFADAGTLVNATGNYVNAGTGQTTAFSGNDTLAPTMKTFYDTQLLENARPNLVHAQLAGRQALPRNHGKTVEWRKWNTLKDAEELTEGVIPTGQKMGQTSTTGAIKQIGLYVTVSDQLAHTAATSRAGLDMTAKLTPDEVNKAVTTLKKMKAPKIDGKYVAIIHPSVAYDLRSSDAWVEAHKYADVTPLFSGEIGELHGVRFVETTEAKIFNNSTCPVKTAAADGNPAVYYSVYATLFLGKDAYKMIDPEGGNLQMIVKGKDEIGGPLNQFSTVGYKAEMAAKLLYEDRMVRVESCSAYSGTDAAN